MFILGFPPLLSRPITPCLAQRSGISPRNSPINVISSYKAKSPGAVLKTYPALTLSIYGATLCLAQPRSEAQKSVWWPPNTHPKSRLALSGAWVCRETPLCVPQTQGSSQRSHGLQGSAPINMTLHAHGRKAEKKRLTRLVKIYV